MDRADTNANITSTDEQLAQRHRSLIEHTPDGICVHENGTVVYVNPAMIRMLRAENADELLGEQIDRFVHPDSVPAMEHLVGTVTAGSPSPPTELALIRTDGKLLPVEAVSVLAAWHDQFAHQVVLHDLSAQRAAEAAQRRAEQHFTSVVSQLEEGVVVIDADGRIESVNPAAQRIFGIEDRHLVGTEITQLPLQLLDANAQPLPTTRHPVARTSSTGETITGYVFGVDRPDGQRRWLSGSSRILNPGEARSAVVSSFADITEFRAGRRQLEYQATHDGLTGLANRSLILGQLSGALAMSAQQMVSTVMFIDLDDFKTINDTLGHAIGDTVLQIVAQRLQRALRAEDTVGRLGGDEFLVLLAGPTPDAELGSLETRLRAAMSEPIVARGHRVEVCASIGAIRLQPGDPRSPEAVLHDADLEMYRAKPPGQRDGQFVSDRVPNSTRAS